MFDNTEEVEIINFDGATINYKNEILKAFRQCADPFNTEIIGTLDYSMNPAEPTAPLKTVEIAKYE
mgnify:FL=1